MEQKTMSPEELALIRRDAALPLEYQSPGDDERGRLLAHIAALEAERDEMVRDRANVQANKDECNRQRHRIEGEVDALRERVQALEADIQAQTEVGVRESTEATAALVRAQEAEHTLAAIRQRARDTTGLLAVYVQHTRTEPGLAAVARHIVGEDATGAPPECICEHAGEGRACETCHPPASPEPSTTEANASVRKALGWIGDDSADCYRAHDAAGPALSLLERRIEAMPVQLREHFAKVAASSGNASVTGRQVAARIRYCALPALTGAPRVFTLEEVKQACAPYFGDGPTMAVLERLAALHKG